jgi:hypothetical protein
VEEVKTETIPREEKVSGFFETGRGVFEERCLLVLGRGESVLVLKHHLDRHAGKVKHIDGVELVVKAVLPIDLDVNVANVLLGRREVGETILGGGCVVDKLAVSVCVSLRSIQ